MISLATVRRNKLKRRIDWIIHAVSNGIPCADCGKTENSFIPGACIFHTHGLAKYGHPDLQIVIEYPPQEIARILNTIGLRIQDGARFAAGDLIEGIYEDCDVRLDTFEETGRNVLRVIIPDKFNRFPENPNCEFPYNLQAFPTDMLSGDLSQPMTLS